MPIVHDFQQIFAVGGRGGSDAPVIEDKEIECGPGFDEAQEAPIAVGEAEEFKETWEPQVADGAAQATGQVATGTGEPGFRLAMAIPL